MKVPRESFVVYRSFLESMDCMPTQDAKNRFIEMIFHYGLDGIVPEKENTAEYIAFLGARPVIESACNRNDKKKENGLKGGRPRNDEQENSEAEEAYSEMNTRYRT